MRSAAVAADFCQVRGGMALAFPAPMTTGASMGARHLLRQACVPRIALALLGVLLCGAVQAESGPSSSEGQHCAAGPASVSNCKNDTTIRDQDEASPMAPGDPASGGDRDDVDGRAKQIETMNQQLRMERRRKDSLLHLYPDEAAHNAARAHDLADKDRPIRAAEDRIDDLQRERKRISEAIGFYAGKPVPADLRNQSQRIDIALQDARATLRNCRDEKLLVSKTYDDELGVLRKLWAAQRKG